ncbi:MAG: hypothetical protein C4291_05800 [Candidatus Dadabacteria bacterium]
MYYSNNLNKVRCFFSYALFIIGQGPGYRSSPSKFKNLGITSEPKVESHSPFCRSPVVNLELRKNHPLFVKYHSRFFNKEVEMPWREEISLTYHLENTHQK